MMTFYLTDGSDNDVRKDRTVSDLNTAYWLRPISSSKFRLYKAPNSFAAFQQEKYLLNYLSDKSGQRSFNNNYRKKQKEDSMWMVFF